jgi:hypothetical protein
MGGGTGKGEYLDREKVRKKERKTTRKRDGRHLEKKIFLEGFLGKRLRERRIVRNRDAGDTRKGIKL